MPPFIKTNKGEAYNASIEKFLNSRKGKSLIGKVNLIFTSPPYPLVVPKKYGNKQGEEYLEWIAKITNDLSKLLTENGSLVVEIGNAWNKGSPTMSTLPIETLIAISKSSDLQICQQFIWHNPGKLPGPATWVNVKRERITDSFTHIWWYSNSEHPKADNRNVLTPYTNAMKNLIKTKKYNHGHRPSGHKISETGFLSDNGGSIARSALIYANTGFDTNYRDWCKEKNVPQHPARMPIELAEFFIKLLTDKNDLVLDPFGGSCTTGKAAESLNRKWICIEQNKEYLIGAKGRFMKNKKKK
jgi:site-specific DNA-methyltransferase (cytosine-N4-specific)